MLFFNVIYEIQEQYNIQTKQKETGALDKGIKAVKRQSNLPQKPRNNDSTIIIINKRPKIIYNYNKGTQKHNTSKQTTNNKQ